MSAFECPFCFPHLDGSDSEAIRFQRSYLTSFPHIFGGLPSGKLRFSYGKSQFSMGKSTISMVIFNSYVSLPEGTSPAIGAFSNHHRGPLFPSAAGWTGPWHGLQWRGGFEDFSHGLFNPPKDGCLATYIRIYIYIL